jgi:hypothetical protein
MEKSIDIDRLMEQQDSPKREQRLDALRRLKEAVDSGMIQSPSACSGVNNHIHTTYSFSPYSPAKAVWLSYMAGLCTAGIVDHDSVSGVNEFIAAGEILDFPTTSGMEFRVTHSGTKLGMRHTNNPDQQGLSYILFHGIPRDRLDAVDRFIAPVRQARSLRNRAMCKRIAELSGIEIDYDRDILPFSRADEGGSVTERHLLWGLAGKLLDKYGKGDELISYLKKMMDLSSANVARLSDYGDQWFQYHLLGVMKACLIDRVYIPANREECPDITTISSFARANGIILTYPYLGNVTASPTGDKSPQEFEDNYLDELFEVISGLGFIAVSYMPARNTREQLVRIRAFCERYGMFQISGEDINMPTQAFSADWQKDPEFSNLHDAAWALIGHECSAQKDINDSFLRTDISLSDKISYFNDIALQRYPLSHVSRGE